ncbi:MAG: AMP-binding protein, partial [Cyanobacteria bacterium NC_groundwater_1444_Ag_S-0.65um_54_12]|nr:AMP-binding protein [Cyanobacteria bacterium NC_groundwater_1444_Ag_S-0.65um_54_12]
RAAARDVCLWDQNACSSAQVLYVEGPERLTEFVSMLKVELAALANSLPMGTLGIQEKAEITKQRELAWIAVALGQAELHTSPGPEWTVIVEQDPSFKLSPLFRTVYVKAVADLREVATLLAPYRSYLQTIGLTGSEERLLELADTLGAGGALRVRPLGSMSDGHPGEPHDGVFALHELVKWISLEAPVLQQRFDPIDFLSKEAISELQWTKLQAAYRRVRRLSPFYARYLPDQDLQSLTDWNDLPILTKEIYRAEVPPNGQELLCDQRSDGLVLRTGGSSGNPQIALVSWADFLADMRAGARGFWAAGLRPGDTVANLFHAGNLYGSFLSTQRILEFIGCRSFPLTSHIPVADILEALRTFQIEVLIGLPSHLQLVFAAMRENPDHYRVRKVLYGGEHFYQREQRIIRETLGIEQIASIGYGTVDAGPIAYQCPANQGSLHHVLADHQYVEILDPELLQPVLPGAVGLIVVTNLHPRLMPLIRYRVGDLGKSVPGVCPCGRFAPLVELLGRADDVVVVGGYNLAYSEIQAVVERFAEFRSLPQLEVRRDEQLDHLLVKVELCDTRPDILAGEESAKRVEQLRRQLLDTLTDLRKSLNQGMLGSLEIDILPPGGLERLQRSGKIRHIIDRRQAGVPS